MAKRPELTSGNKDVVAEAFEHRRKRGGRVKHEYKHGGAVAKHRLDRKSGGGADKHPLAAQSSKAPFSSAKRG